MKTMQNKNGILDLRNKKLYFSDNPDDVCITVKKANTTTVYDLEQAPGGYFMLPCAKEKTAKDSVWPVTPRKGTSS